MSDLVKMEENLSPEEKKKIEEAVVFINEKAQETIYRGAEEIGAYILENFFNNDIVEATSRNPRKSLSYRTLCKHPNLVIKFEQLSVMVRVAAQERFLLDNHIDTTKLSYSHKAELVKLDNGTDKLALLKSLISKPLSVRELQDKVWRLRKDSTQVPQVSLIGLLQHVQDPDWLLSNPLRKELLNDTTRRREHIARMTVGKRQALLGKLNDGLKAFMECGRLYEAMKDDIQQVEAEAIAKKAEAEESKARIAEERKRKKEERDKKKQEEKARKEEQQRQEEEKKMKSMEQTAKTTVASSKALRSRQGKRGKKK